MSVVPSKARAVIVGGGVVGASVAYHLTKLGWEDVVLLERKRLTSGTTWHAAGLIASLRATANMTKLAAYSAQLYDTLEEETGLATGYKRCGSITVALTHERREEILRQAAMARSYGVEVEEISPQEVKDRYPHLNIDGVIEGVYLPTDGQADPTNITLALARGAKMRGAAILEQTAVCSFSKDKTGRRVTGVQYEQEDGTVGEIECEHVVNCAGMWAYEVGLMAGVNVPLHACEHFYMVSEPIAGLEQLPVLRVPDECAYYKVDAGKLLLGAFEPVAKPWASPGGGTGGIPADFEFDELPYDFEHFEPVLDMAVRRMPPLASAGVHTFFNGPESFTPDDAYHLGLAPEMDNVWVAAGFNSVGIQSAGGAGKALAQWMEDGPSLKPFDVGDVDVSRMQPFQRNSCYLRERSTETLGLLYADHFPFRQKVTARGVRRSPFHAQLADMGAVMGEVAGWERANWFADEGQEREYKYSWKSEGQNFFDNVRREHLAFRHGVGVYDMSSFGKLRVEGPHAETFLNYACGGDMSVAVGQIVYTQMLNSRGGVEADVTVTRLSDDAFLVVTPAATRLQDETWLRRTLHGYQRNPQGVVVTDVTAAEGCLAVMGPNARLLLQKLSPSTDWSNDRFPFGSAQEVELGMGLARAHRVSYVGEQGWELYVSADVCAHALEHVVAVTMRGGCGEQLGMRWCGMHSVDSCRLEKGYRHFGHDITCEDHVLEAGLGFAVKLQKESGDFVGRDAVLRKKEEGLSQRLLQFCLHDPSPQLYHHEPILRDGKVVGFLTSGAYGHFLGGAVGLGYVPCAGEKAKAVLASDYEIDIAGERVRATASLRPMYDPKSERAKA